MSIHDDVEQSTVEIEVNTRLIRATTTAVLAYVAQQQRLFNALLALGLRWEEEQATYPPGPAAQAAAAVMRLCTAELRAALADHASEVPRVDD